MWSQTRYIRVADNLFAPRNAPPFGYSDGEIEDYIASVVDNAVDRSVMSRELTGAVKDWASHYHLAYGRSFLLRSVRRLLEGKRVLELGAGCGALTRYLGETAAGVTAIEGSGRRARIAAARCRDLPNVVVVNDTIQEMECAEQFDTVTLIGVLEYARTFGPQDGDPVSSILGTAKSFLKPGGKLLLAMENQLGLKYFAGAGEDHIGYPFFGLHDLYTDKTPVTFGRKELQTRLSRAGFATIEQLVPLPDYKFPATVLYPACFRDEESAVDITPFIQNSYRLDSQKASEHCFSLEAATGPMVRNGLAGELCNSLFFVAGAEPDNPAFADEVYVAHYGSVRAPEYVKETMIFRENGALRVTRRAIAPVAPAENSRLRNVLEDEAYLALPLYHDSLVPLINTPGWNVHALAVWAKGWADFLQRNALENAELPGMFLDATPLNCAVKADGGCVFFDREWVPADGRSIPLSRVVFRGLCQSLGWFENVAPPAERTPTRVIVLAASIMSRLGIPLEPERMDEYIRMELEFQAQATLGAPDPEAFRSQSLEVRLLA